MALTAQYVLSEINKHADVLRGFGVKKIGLFGSVARGEAREDSDLDFVVDMEEWTFGGFMDTAFFLEDHFHRMVGAISVESANAHRSVTFNESLANKLGEQRDNLSGVSLDEEMINMIKYQHAYNVASKLLTVADEMLSMLISTRR